METADQESFQGRYVLNHPWTGSASCAAAIRYRSRLPDRFEQEAKNLADLTGWPRPQIETRMRQTGETTPTRK